jgi:hypothetical protein
MAGLIDVSVTNAAVYVAMLADAEAYAARLNDHAAYAVVLQNRSQTDGEHV